MGNRSRALRASLLGAAFVMGLIWFLFVGVLAKRMNKTTTVTMYSTAKAELLKLLGTKKHAVHWDLDINYVSKRVVPSGPDPIHNRKVVKFRQPPGQV